MANKVWKYYMQRRDCYIEMPVGAKILSCQKQGGSIYFWCLVNEEEKETELRHFVAVGTGCDMPFPIDNAEFVATIQAGFLVHHIFEIRAITNMGGIA